MGQFDQVHSTKKYRLLTTKQDVAGNTYIYLKGVASLVAYDVVTYDEAGATTLLAANAKGPVAVAQAAVDSATEYGWFMIAGVTTVNIAANSADNATVGREGADGKVGDGRAAGDQIANFITRTATTGAATGTAQLRFPYVDDFIGA